VTSALTQLSWGKCLAMDVVCLPLHAGEVNVSKALITVIAAIALGKQLEK